VESVSISEFKATCIELLHRVQATGQPILVTRRGEPVALINPPPPPMRPPAVLGALADRTRILGDLVSPLDTDDWEALRE
jgi:prevent-host-death family protein